MRVKELIEKLEKLDPQEDVYVYDSEYGMSLVSTLGQEEVMIETENDFHLPKKVWCLYW